MVELEKQGIPTVIFTAQAFVKDARQSAKSFGLKNLPLAVVPLPFSNQTPESIRKMVDDCFDQVVVGLTRAVSASETEPIDSDAASEAISCGPMGCELAPQDAFQIRDERLFFDGSYNAEINHTTHAKVNQAVGSHEDQ